MIGRVWHGMTLESKGEAFHDYMIRTGVKDCRATEGNRGVMILKSRRDGRAHFLFISFWESFEAIRRFAGDEMEKAVYYPEDKEFLLELEPTVVHYEVCTHSLDPVGR